jgi:hypothetical protein
MPSPWPRSSTTPACRPACSTSSPATARRSAKPWSRIRGGHGVLHRLHRRRQAHLATRRQYRQARGAGTRRQIGRHRARRRRLCVAVKGVVGNCYLNAGQTCTAQTRLLVPASALRRSRAHRRRPPASSSLGDPCCRGTTLGPLASKMQQDRVRDYIAKGIAEGCELLAGGAALPDGRARRRLLRAADRVRPRGSQGHDRPGGNLRPGAVHHHLHR